MNITEATELTEQELITLLNDKRGWTMRWDDGVYRVSIPNVGDYTCKAPANLPIFYNVRR